MDQTATTTTTRPTRAARTAGALLILLGVANASLAVLALAGDLIRLAPPAAGGLLVAGLLTALTGVLVWHGSGLALAVALTIFGLLLVVQFGEVAAGGAAGALPRLGVLTVLVAALAVAQSARARRRRSPADRGPDG